MSLPSEDVQWLKDLHDRYYPYENQFKKPVVTAYETAEFERVLRLIEEHDLLTEMISAGMFGAYGMQVYGDSLDQTGRPEFLLLVHEEHIPPPTRFQRIGGDVEPWPKKTPGSGFPHAWKIFSKYTHSEKNAAKLAFYRMDPPRESSYYDY